MLAGRYYAVIPNKGDKPELYQSFEVAENTWFLYKAFWHGWVTVAVDNRE